MTNDRPRIVFGMPSVSGLADLIEEALEEEGFELISLPKLAAASRRYPSFGAFLYAKFRKWCGDKEAAKEMKGRVLIDLLGKHLAESGGMADYALFVSGDIYGKTLLDYVRQHSRNGSVNYQFDGLHRFPAIEERRVLFDRFYAFDPDDVSGCEAVLPASNFYFATEDLPISENSFYFTGVHLPERAERISELTVYLQSLGLQADVNIICKTKLSEEVYPSGVKVQQDSIGFRQNLEKAKKSRILVDFVAADHKGLSFRTFEALGYRKKLITTNVEIKKYDFYHPDNIFIWDGGSLDGLAAFLQRPYCEIDEALYRKYSFGNWLRYVLNRPPYQPIDLPVSHLAAE